MEDNAKTSAGKTAKMRRRRNTSDDEAQWPPADSEALHGNQQQCHKQSSSCIPIASL
ncbi:hypothetical protein [Priestia megaterium]|uniref:hypothetical protein n=1 Tax=Priestia megaterium TaxID=1404 RepID=UPI002E1FED55|nr:hypothetical protein [Priestia megaterium]